MSVKWYWTPPIAALPNIHGHTDTPELLYTIRDHQLISPPQRTHATDDAHTLREAFVGNTNGWAPVSVVSCNGQIKRYFRSVYIPFQAAL